MTVLLGVLLLPARLPARALVVGAAVVALVLSGVFLPTFSMQILNGVLVAAVFIVAVMWSVAWVVRRRGSSAPTAAAVRHLRQPSRRSRKRRREGRPMRKKHFKCKCKLQIADCHVRIVQFAIAICSSVVLASA